MIIAKVREYFLHCPILDEFTKLNINYLGAEAKDYTIDPVPAESIIKKYVDGGAIKQYIFVFASREFYGNDTMQNIESSGFYEKLSSWIEEQNKIGNLPELKGGKKPIELSISTSGYLFGASEDSARYQIQMRLTYYEE